MMMSDNITEFLLEDIQLEAPARQVGSHLLSIEAGSRVLRPEFMPFVYTHPLLSGPKLGGETWMFLAASKIRNKNI